MSMLMSISMSKLRGKSIKEKIEEKLKETRPNRKLVNNELKYYEFLEEVYKFDPKLLDYVNLKNEIRDINKIDNKTDEIRQKFNNKYEIRKQMAEDIKEYFSKIKQLFEDYMVSFDRELQLMQSTSDYTHSEKKRIRVKIRIERIEMINVYEVIKNSYNKHI